MTIPIHPVVELSVPCGSCSLCCQKDMVLIHPELGDDPAQYLTKAAPGRPGALMLQHKQNGDCIYLGDSGCTIHARRPAICREFDCRVFAKALGYTKSRKLVKQGRLRADVIRRGRQLAKGKA